MRFLSFAKINLALEVLRRRDDGFHELRTVFQTIDLADEIDLLPAKSGIRLTITGTDGLPADERNLAWRAAAGFLQRWGRAGEGVEIRLHKQIPLGGGLGGGSSNAATVLAGLAVLLRRNPGRNELETLAAELGSDVPFFLHGGTALGTGRGERIEPLPDPQAAPLDLWLALPPVAVSTAAVFAAHRVREAVPLPRDNSGAAVAPAWGELLGRNDLEPTCLKLYPAVSAVYNRLSESGAAGVRLSGSGSTIYALFRDRAAGQAAGDRLEKDTIWLPVKTLRRDEWLRRSGLDALSGGC
jgi:4-diphosphocytidyl-2-C-methyl-D-erythritol kinase